MEFRKFLLKEHLPILAQGKPHPIRKVLESHPLVKKSKFGIEIEFKAFSAPLKGLPPKETDQEFKDYFPERDLPKELWDYDSEELWQDSTIPLYDRIISGYWIDKTIFLINELGFKAFADKNNGNETWAVGPDGKDSSDDVPIIEIRTPPLDNNPETFEKIKEFLYKLQKFLKENNKFLKVAGNTGLHIHVSNPKTIDRPFQYDVAGIKYGDPFTRLAAIIGVDENQIWNDMAIHDRDFEKFATMNKQQDFSGHRGIYQQIITIIRQYLGIQSTGRNQKATKIINLNELYKIVSSFERNAGVNVKSEHPTIEYRYLSSALLTKNDGPDKIIDYIQYFIQHAASQSNKNRIIINGDWERVVLTRVFNGVQIDYQQSEYNSKTDKEEYKRIPQPAVPNEDLTKIKNRTDPRPIDAPAKDWYDQHRIAFSNRVKQLKGKYQLKT